MNHTYSIVWNAARQMWMVASEKTTFRGGGIKVVLCTAALPLMLLAQPGAASPYLPVYDALIGAGENQTVSAGQETIFSRLQGVKDENGRVTLARQSVGRGGKSTGSVIGAAGKIDVNAGGETRGTIITRDGVEFIASGATATGTTLQSGGLLDVDVNGTATGIVQNAGGALKVNTGAAWVEGTHSANVTFSVQNGVARDLLLELGGSLEVLNGDRSTGTILNNLGREIINGGAVATETTINAGGVLDVKDNGTATGITQNAGGALKVTTAVTEVSGTHSGDAAFSVKAGAAHNLLLENGGELTVLAGHFAGGTIINNGGIEVINAGGASEGSTINHGGILAVEEQGSATGIVQNAGGALQLSTAAGRVQGTHSGDRAFSVTNGKATNMLLGNEGWLHVLSGDSSSVTTINQGGMEVVFGGGSAMGSTINAGGTLAVDDKGTATGIMQNAGGALIVNTAAATVQGTHSGDVEFTVSRGQARNVLLENDGRLVVLARNSSVNTTINDGGAEYVNSYATSTGSALNAGGLLAVDERGSATNIVQKGGALQLSTAVNSVSGWHSANLAFSVANGKANNLLLENGGSLAVLDAHSATGTTINRGGLESVLNGGTATGSTINNGGVLSVHDRGTAMGIIQNAGGALQVTTAAKYVGGKHSGNVEFSISDGSAHRLLLENGGKLTILEGNSASETAIGNGGQAVVLSGGLAAGSTLNAGGILNVQENGTALAVAQQAGGALQLSTAVKYVGGKHSGDVAFNVYEGKAKNLLLENGGVLEVLSGHSASGTTLNRGGQEITSGQTVGTTVNAFGLQTVAEGGNATATTVNQSGVQLINFRGQADSTVINSEGLQNIALGGRATDTLINHGGTQFINSGGEAIDSTLAQDGTLAVQDGGKAFGIRQQSGGVLVLTTAARVDGKHSGNVNFSVVDGKASNLLLENGGQLTVLNHHEATNTTVKNNGQLLVASGSTLSGRTEIGIDGKLTGMQGERTQVTNNGELVWDAPLHAKLSMMLTGEGRMSVNDGNLILENAQVKQKNIGMSGDAHISLNGGSQLSGAVTGKGEISLTDHTLWQATGDSSLSTLNMTDDSRVILGSSQTQPPVTLTLGNLHGDGGTIALHTDIDSHQSDHLLVDGGAVTGLSLLDIMIGDKAGRPTTGDGIAVVEVSNGGTTETDSFALAHAVEGGAYNYNLRRNTQGAWHLSTDLSEPEGMSTLSTPDYRNGLSAYLSAPMAASQLADLLADQAYRGRKAAADRGLWMNAGGGHLGVHDAGNLRSHDRSELSGLQGGIVLGVDVWGYDSAAYSLWSGVYAATGHSDLNAWRNDEHAGTVKDQAWAGGAYLGYAHDGGARAQLSMQGTHHRVSSSTDTSKKLSTEGRGWSVATEVGYAIALTARMNLEPYVGWQYHYTGLNDARDEVSRLKWGSERRQGGSAGLRLGNIAERNITGQMVSASQLPVSWWAGASVTRGYGKGAMLEVSAPGVAQSDVDFHGQDTGTSGRLDAGLMAEIRPAVTLGAAVNGHTRLAGNGPEGYGGELKLRVGF